MPSGQKHGNMWSGRSVPGRSGHESRNNRFFGWLFFLSLAGALIFGGSVTPLRGAEPLSFRHGAVATANPIATEIGVQVFRAGGNSFDVAVAVGFALAVCHPQAGNIGGGGFAVVRDSRTRQVTSLDFREVAPSGATERMFLDSSGAVVRDLSTLGALAAGVPGTVAGLHELWKRFGSLSWSRLLAPAVALADSGLMVDDALAASLAEEEAELRVFGETEAVFFPNGRVLRAGDRLIQKELAATLRLLATDGPVPFYSGPVADQIVACMQAHGGLITREDLAGYRPVWREPIRFEFDSLEFYSMAPPSSGGVIYGQILKLLEPFDLAAYTSSSPDYIHLFCEAAKLAYADRSMHLGDPEFFPVPKGLLDSGYLAHRRTLINRTQATPSAEIQPGAPPDRESAQTTHYSVCDSAGNMVAITYTLNTAYGSRLVVAGAGFLLNNEMDDFSIKPGVPNVYGLVGGEANKIAPKKRMLSSMSPTVVLREGRPYLVLGTPGGSRIISTVAEAILAYVRFHKSLAETAALPRFHHQWQPDKLFLEEASFAPSVAKALEALGHTVVRGSSWCDIQMVAIDSIGVITAVSDPRRNGQAGGY